MLARWTVAGAATWAVAALGVAPPALAQPVFFDDFDGDELLPHWGFDPTRWEHSVSGGMLHVTDLLRPSQPHSPANWAIIAASFEPQMDFRMDLWMGWENPTEPWNESVFRVIGGAAGILTQFGMRHVAGEPPEILAAASGAGRVTAPAPPPGIYQFTITRTGSQFDFYLDGDLISSFPDTFGVPAGGISVFFSKPFPGEMNPYHIDRVRVVPAPATLIVPTLCVLACARRRR